MGRAVILGLLIAVLAQCLALLMLGAGHGWGQPFYFTPVLFILYPIVLIRLMAPQELASLALDVLLLVAAVILDVLLVRATQAEGIQYFHRVMSLPPFPHLWVFLWLLWQALALKRILTSLLHKRG